MSRASIGARLSRAVEVPGSIAVGAKPPRCLRLAKRRRQRGPPWGRQHGGLLSMREADRKAEPHLRCSHAAAATVSWLRKHRGHGAFQPARRRRAPLHAAAHCTEARDPSVERLPIVNSVSLIAGDNYIPIRQTNVIAVLIAWPLQCRRGMANVLE